MPKYYVKSGQLEIIIVAPNPLMAACEALEKAQGQTIDPYFFYVDERGFRDGGGPHSNVVDDFNMPSHLFRNDEVFQTKGDDE